MLSLSTPENTTNAPPWYREIRQNTIAPSKLTMARPISRIAGGAVAQPALRVLLGGAAAMAITALVGQIAHVSGV
jgi:hypothetical protein